ncbi:hypothetical protein NQ176_g10190 [Zarea fungicola]|uniref:Uncharacterized protein n=1 Tax=Zarea fungicola TaxID=93591 RepID=A0ACC1MJB3_9HYPO|nr:hypothetical protein NQ176_g10190 [Lecanicillium fungicola]
MLHDRMQTSEERDIKFESLPLSGVQVESTEIDGSSIILTDDETEPDAVTATVIPETRTIRSPVLPSRGASVRAVQDYIRSTLVVHHDAEFEVANQMAIRWHLGRGHLLRQLPAEKFTEFFGTTWGPHLCWDVQEDLRMEQELNDQRLIQEWQQTKEFLIWRSKQ